MFENIDLTISSSLFFAGLWTIGPLAVWILFVQVINFSTSRKSSKQSR